MRNLNLFFNFLRRSIGAALPWPVLLLFLFSGLSAHAVNLYALYTASCQREVGIILGVTPRQVLLLNLTGEIVKVERFEVIYFSSYPLDTVPVAEVSNPELVPLIEIKTYQRGGLVPLVKGWPVDFSKDKVSFLTLSGSEVMIDRSSIWDVRSVNESHDAKFLSRPEAQYEFVHPYAFSSCPAQIFGSHGKSVKVYPQQLLSDPIPIKRELDRMQAGHAQIRQYESDEQFYAVPELYGNETFLGLWHSAGARYGASSYRQNNFTPLLSNRFSSGPFGFQSEFLSGSGPLPQSIHEEMQTQIYYRMKADYFHFSGMLDPNLLLVGDKYKWFDKDFDAVDTRAVESAMMEFGFDYGMIGLEMYLGGAVNVGARQDQLFRRSVVSLPWFGVRVQGNTWTANVMAGNASQDNFSIQFFRANFQWEPSHNWRWMFSVIKRDVSFDGAADVDPNITFQVDSKTWTAATYGYFRFKKRYWAGLTVSVESVEHHYESVLASGAIAAKVYPKGGAMLALTF